MPAPRLCEVKATLASVGALRRPGRGGFSRPDAEGCSRRSAVPGSATAAEASGSAAAGDILGAVFGDLGDLGLWRPPWGVVSKVATLASLPASPPSDPADGSAVLSLRRLSKMLSFHVVVRNSERLCWSSSCCGMSSVLADGISSRSSSSDGCGFVRGAAAESSDIVCVVKAKSTSG